MMLNFAAVAAVRDCTRKNNTVTEQLNELVYGRTAGSILLGAYLGAERSVGIHESMVIDIKASIIGPVDKAVINERIDVALNQMRETDLYDVTKRHNTVMF